MTAIEKILGLLLADTGCIANGPTKRQYHCALQDIMPTVDAARHPRNVSRYSSQWSLPHILPNPRLHTPILVCTKQIIAVS